MHLHGIFKGLGLPVCGLGGCEIAKAKLCSFALAFCRAWLVLFFGVNPELLSNVFRDIVRLIAVQNTGDS